MARQWKSTVERHDHYQEVTDRIIAFLEKDVVPWRQQWDSQRAGAPHNGTTGHTYRGINRLLLGLQSLSFGADPRWCSYRQAEAKGWQVRRGESGTRIYFYRRIAKEGHGVTDGGTDDRRSYFPVLKAYTIFHFSQIEGAPEFVPPEYAEVRWQQSEAMQTIIDASGIEVRTVTDRACYVPSQDLLCLPSKHAFDSAELMAEVMAHEFAHATSHPLRLDRKISSKFGSPAYAFEELVVSIATCLVGSVLGFAVDEANQASYIDNWLTALRHEKRLIFSAASEAQRITDYILALHPDYAAAHAADHEEDEGEESARVVQAAA